MQHLKRASTGRSRFCAEAMEPRICLSTWGLIGENVQNTFSTAGRSVPFVGAADGAYYIGVDAAHGAELWFGDGRGRGGRLVKDVRPGRRSSSIELLGSVGSIGYFAADDGVGGRTLWKTDGTAGGTTSIRAIRATGAGAELNGALYFAADDGTHGTELWRSDGTARGTIMIADIRRGAGASAPQHLTVAHGRLFFIATDSSGVGLFASDGTKSSTIRLRSGVGGTYLNVVKLGNTWVIGNQAGLWATDRALNGTTRALPAHLSWSGLAVAGGKVLFAGPSGLWQTDGTVGGTRAIAGLPGALDTVVGFGAVAGGAVVHTGSNIGGQIWFTDGTATGSRRLVANRSSVFDEDISFNDVHLFTHVGGYWQTDGTQAGTFGTRLAGGQPFLEGPLVLGKTGQAVLLLSGSNMGDTPAGQGYLRKLWAYSPSGSVSGVVFNDGNGDGRVQAGEQRLAGFRVYADANGNGRFDAGETSARSDARGQYHLNHASGTPRVRVVGVDGWVTRADGYTLPLGVGKTARRHFALSRPARLSGSVFVDSNGNGRRDALEGLLTGWQVFLDLDNDRRLDADEPNTVTDGRGNWSFENLVAGSTTVRVAGRSGWAVTTAASKVLALAPGQTSTGHLFGVRPIS